MVYLSHLEKNRLNIIDIATPAAETGKEQYNPRNFIREQDIQALLDYIDSEGNFESVWVWLRLWELVVLFPEKKQELASKLRKHEPQFASKLQSTTTPQIVKAELLATGRNLYSEKIKEPEFDLNTNTNLVKDLLEGMEKDRNKEAWASFVTIASTFKLAFPNYFTEPVDAWLNSMYDTLYDGSSEDEADMAVSGYLSELRLLFPERYKATPTQLARKKTALESTRITERTSRFWVHAFELAVMAADEVHISNQGIHLVFGTNVEESNEKVAEPPVRRNF